MSSPPTSFTARLAILRATWDYPGWRVVVIGFFMFLLAFGAPLTMPFVYPEVMNEFGWTLTQATLVYTYKSLTGAIMAIFIVGPVVDKLGLKPVLVLAMLSEAIGMGSFLFIDSLWTYYLAGFLIGIGHGAVLICIKLLVARWFVRNVGLAGGFAIVGASFGGIIFPLIMSQLIPLYGWRIAFACLSLGIFCISIPLALLANANPTDEQILPEVMLKKDEPVSADKLREAEIVMGYGVLFRSKSFWFIAAATMLSALVDQALFQHSIYYLTEEVGLSTTVAASAWSVTFFVGIFAKFIAGTAFDKFSVKGVSLWNLLLIVAMGLALPASGFFTALVFTSVLGMAHGGLVVDSPVVAKHVYGPRYMNRLLPVLAGFNTAGSAIGPVLLAKTYDVSGSYVWGFAGFAVLVAMAALLMWQVRPEYRDRLRDGGTRTATPPMAEAQPN